jgi:hypothetical protein
MMLRLDRAHSQPPAVDCDDPAVKAFRQYVQAIRNQQFSEAVEPRRRLALMGFEITLRRPSR